MRDATRELEKKRKRWGTTGFDISMFGGQCESNHSLGAMSVTTTLARSSFGLHCTVVRSGKARTWAVETRSASSRRRGHTSRVLASSDGEGESESRSDVRPKKRRAESTDAVASFLSRRFGTGELATTCRLILKE